MVDVISRVNKHYYAELLDDMYRRRYAILVDGMGWKIPGIEPGYDRDAFDTDDTVYLVDTHPQTGELTACARFNPTTKPHLMSEVFADQCELSGVPRRDDIWELSRLVYDYERMDRQLFRRTRGAFGVAMTELCLFAGIHALTWVTRKDLYASTLHVWPTRPLGLPRYFPDDDAEYVAAISDMNEAALQGRHKWRGCADRVLYGSLPKEDVPPVIRPHCELVA